MRTIEKYTSPDGRLTLAVEIGIGDEVAIGFEGGSWHTHPDLLSQWLDLPQEQAVVRFVELVQWDLMPIIISTDGGKTTDPWVSDNLSETIRLFGRDMCVLRYWSGKGVTL